MKTKNETKSPPTLEDPIADAKAESERLAAILADRETKLAAAQAKHAAARDAHKAGAGDWAAVRIANDVVEEETSLRDGARDAATAAGERYVTLLREAKYRIHREHQRHTGASGVTEQIDARVVSKVLEARKLIAEARREAKAIIREFSEHRSAQQAIEAEIGCPPNSESSVAYLDMEAIRSIAIGACARDGMFDLQIDHIDAGLTAPHTTISTWVAEGNENLDAARLLAKGAIRW